MASNVTRDHHTWTRDTVKNVSGDVTLDLAGDLTIDVAGGQCTITDSGVSDPDLILQGTSSLANGPQFYIKHDSSSPAINDYPGAIYFQGRDDGGNNHNYAQISCQIKGVVDGSELSKLVIGAASPTVSGGLILEGISIGRVDANIGLGSASLTTIAGDLDIDGDTITSAGALEIDAGGTVSITGQHFSIDSATKLSLDGGGGDTYITESSSNVIAFIAGGTTRLSLSSVTALFNDNVALGATKKLHFDGFALGADTYIHEVSADKLEFVVGDDEMLTLDEANQRVTIEADKLTYAIAGGTEWGAIDSAYAGHILAYTCIGADVNYDSYTLTTSFVCFQDSGGAEIYARFKTPPSEFVEIEVELYFSSGSGASDLFLSLSNNATYASNTLHHDAQFEKLVCTPARGNGGTVVQKFLLDADNLEAVGSINNIWIAAKTDSTSGTPLISWGGDGTGEFTNLVMKATALPVNIIVGS